jgi:hypothetical protein
VKYREDIDRLLYCLPGESGVPVEELRRVAKERAQSCVDRLGNEDAVDILEGVVRRLGYVLEYLDLGDECREYKKKRGA